MTIGVASITQPQYNQIKTKNLFQNFDKKLGINNSQ